MKNKSNFIYAIFAFLVLILAIVWFFFSINIASKRGIIDSERNFSWIVRETTSLAISEGFMADSFVHGVEALCQKSRTISALILASPSGIVLAWPDNTNSITYDIHGRPVFNNLPLFVKAFSSTLDIGDGAVGSVTLTAVMQSLEPDTIFIASRNSFLLVLAVFIATLIVLLNQSLLLKKPNSVRAERSTESIVENKETPINKTKSESEYIDINDIDVHEKESTQETKNDSDINSEYETEKEIPYAENDSNTEQIPEGLFSPSTGVGWEQYLPDRLEAELARAASSEQDLSLLIIRVSSLVHTDLVSKKIAQILLDIFRFRDMVFEYGSNGFAGMLLNVNLDQSMKIADKLYAEIVAILSDLEHNGKLTIGITTRTARLLPGIRMIEEAASAARKAEEEPHLPIVAFRANPEKYRNFVAENI